MLMLSTATAATILIATRRNKGPTWAMSLMWLICILPMTLGVISYDFLLSSSNLLDEVVAGSMICVAVGAFSEHVIHGGYRRSLPTEQSVTQDFETMRQLGRLMWVLGMAGGVCILADFLTRGGSLLNLSELRDSFVTRQSASTFSRVGSLLTWACLFCYFFALIFRERLRAGEMIFFAVPIIAYLFGALLSAGRQAAFQVLLITIIAQILYRIRTREAKSSRSIIAVISAIMISYMGFIAVARNDDRISDVKAEVLERLFQFRTAPWFDSLASLFGAVVRDTIIEATVYFTSSVALFERFLDTNLEAVSAGAMNFPLLYRQLQPLTGIDVAAMYQVKVAALDSQGVIGVGWTTAVSHLIMDFGFLGAAVALALQGYIGAWSWRRALSGGDYIDCMLAALFVIAAIYLPLLPAFSDTNLFLMALACFAWRLFGPSSLDLLRSNGAREI